MRQETVGVTQALIESAKKEFLENGFHKANLRRISAESGVSTNSIYTRFGDKAGLFDAIVKPVADGLMEMYLECIDEAAECGNADTATAMGDNGTVEVLRYIYDNFDIFRLIFCNSAGTEYEHYFDRLAQIEEKYYKDFVRQFTKGREPVSDFFIHVVCRTGWQYIYELVSHNIPYDEAQKFMESIREYCFAGWACVLGTTGPKDQI